MTRNGLIFLTLLVNTANADSRSLGDAQTQWAEYYSDLYGIPREFVHAVIDVESGWRPYVISNKGAAGTMQLMPATAFRFAVLNRFRLDENIRGGVAYLAHLIRMFQGDLRLAAAAYYAGERRIQAVGLRCANTAIHRYVSAVERRYRLRLQALKTLPSTLNAGTS